jgi:hypothetical protein
MREFPFSWLPNVHGYEFIGVMPDGRHHHCVVRFVDGLHRAYDQETNKPIRPTKWVKYPGPEAQHVG